MSTSTTGGSSYFESTFDYRSLLPSRGGGGAGGPASAVDDGNDNSEDNDSLCYEMSLRERLLGCGTCMIAGYLLSFGSFWRIKDMVVRHDPFPFVVNSTVVGKNTERKKIRVKISTNQKYSHMRLHLISCFYREISWPWRDLFSSRAPSHNGHACGVNRVVLPP